MGKILQTINNQPHLLGHYLGYTKLTQLHTDFIKYCWFSGKDVALQAHRGSYKTTAVIVVGIIWYLILKPETRILILRKEFDGASSVLLEIEKHYKSEKLIGLYNKIHKKNFEHLLLKARRDSLTLITKQNPTKEGNIESCGIGGPLTGRHHDIIVADDFITLKDRISKAEREKTKDFIRELVNIVNPNGFIIYNGTPWHKEDCWSILPKPRKYDIYHSKLPFVTEEFIQKIKAGTTASLFAANYELKHIADENRIFPDPVYGPWPEQVRPRAWLDPSFKGENTTALFLLGEYNDSWYARGWVWLNYVVDIYHKILDILDKYMAGTLYVETNADQGACKNDLSHRYPSVIGRWSKMNKHNKIASFGKRNFLKVIWANNCQSEFMNQILDYEEGQEPDDAPDAMASLFKELGFSGGFKFELIGPEGLMK